MNGNAVFGALFGSNEALGEAVTALARIGRSRESLAVAARSAKTIELLEHDLGVARIDAGIRHDGVLADFARATGQREPAPADALGQELTRRGIDAGRAAYFDERVRNGATLLLVPTRDDDERALAILTARGADLGLANGPGLFRTLQLRREVLDVGKHAVVSNEVVVRTEIVVERKHIELELEHEEFVIERRDPRMPAAPPEITRIPLRHEEAIVRKETYVTGEVTVRTEQRVEVAAIDETLQHEVLRVDDASADPAGQPSKRAE